VRLSAARRLFLSYLLLISLVVLALSLGADSLLRRHLVSLVERDLRRELALDAQLYDARPDLSPDSVADLLGALTDHRVTIIRRDGLVLGESTRDARGIRAMENHLRRPEVRAALRAGAGESVRHSATVGTDQMYMATVSRRGEVVRASVPLAEIDAAVGAVQRGVLGVGAVALLVAALFSFGFSLAVTRPLRRMRSAALRMAEGDLSLRFRSRRTDELGELASVLDVLADELQRRLGQLEGERAEMQALIDSMAEGVLALAPDGTVRRANPAARRFFGLHGAAPGLGAEVASRRPEFLRLVRRALAGEPVAATELPTEGRALLATAQPLPAGGAVVVFLDISELRRLEGVRRDFVANASHELKTPLTAIRGYTETMLDPQLPEELLRRFAGVVHVNARRLQRIVEDLLDLTRIESGAAIGERRSVAVADAAREAWAAQERPVSREVHFEVGVEPGAERVLADPAALHQILTNVFSNALRYTPDQGRVSVVAAMGNGMVEVQVRDTGSGIPAADLPRVFERFYRVDPARSRSEGGTGLGLAIVKHLVGAHGGRVWAESAAGQGTTVHFTLPVPPAG
jgi:two-component system phosphate regulon sensor histidine kinase PhoR